MIAFIRNSKGFFPKSSNFCINRVAYPYNYRIRSFSLSFFRGEGRRQAPFSKNLTSAALLASRKRTASFQPQQGEKRTKFLLTSSSFLGKRLIHVQPEEIHSSDGQKHVISPPNIDFENLREEAASGIFTDKEIHNYALKSLDTIENLNSAIIYQIKQHSSNDSGFKASVHEKINQIMKDIINPSNFPPVFSQDLLTSLVAFFSPISQEYIRLEKELSHEENEQEEKNNCLTLGKEENLGQLLAKEQKILTKFKTFSTFFEILSKEVSNRNATPTVYFAYAWPTDERAEKECWVQPFLQHLQAQLKAAGIHATYLDINSDRLGASIYEYMEKTETSDYVLLFGTESLKNKHNMRLSAVCNELIHILKKREKDLKKSLTRVFPILISGSHEDSFPTEYKMYITVRDWRQGGYLKNFQKLYLELFNFPPERYIDNIKKFWNKALNRNPSESKEIQDTLQQCEEKRQQINGCTDLDDLSKITHADPVDRPISQKIQEFTQKLKERYLDQSAFPVFRFNKKGSSELLFPFEKLSTGFSSDHEKRTDRKTHDLLLAQEEASEAQERVALEDVFKHEALKKASKKRFVIFGGAGAGKTTLIKYINYHWAKEKLWPEYQAIVCLQLRNLTKDFYPNSPKHVYTASDLLEREYHELKVDFKALLKSQDFLNNTLLILDGHDELTKEVSNSKNHLFAAFKELKERFSHILITSRPGPVDINRGCEFEISSFNNEDMTQYIQSYFNQIEENQEIMKQEKFEKIEQVSNYLEKTPLVRSFARIPINLTLMCTLFQENGSIFSKTEMPTITASYQEIVNHLYKWFLHTRTDVLKRDIIEVENPELDPKIKPLARCLEEIAWNAMERNEISVKQETVEEIIDKVNEEYNVELRLGDINHIGLLNVENSRGTFMHPRLQEFFAAKYISNLCLNQKYEEAKEVISEKKPDPRYQLVMSMTAEILSDNEELNVFF